MAKGEHGNQPWEQPEVIYESELWSVVDVRPLACLQVTSVDGGFGFSITYDEWDDFVESIRMTQTQSSVEGELVMAEEMEAEGSREWSFTILYPEHTFVFFVTEEEWKGLIAAVEATAAYPWSETVFRVDVAGMREKVAEQRRWLARRDRQAGGRGKSESPA
ncbi:MAG: hypothetical protein ACYC3S_18070 [Chloroflexota bacterium]